MNFVSVSARTLQKFEKIVSVLTLSVCLDLPLLFIASKSPHSTSMLAEENGSHLMPMMESIFNLRSEAYPERLKRSLSLFTFSLDLPSHMKSKRSYNFIIANYYPFWFFEVFQSLKSVLWALWIFFGLVIFEKLFFKISKQPPFFEPEAPRWL